VRDLDAQLLPHSGGPTLPPRPLPEPSVEPSEDEASEDEP
jgi:hypothetical protein